jgi:hypothetical protein
MMIREPERSKKDLSTDEVRVRRMNSSIVFLAWRALKLEWLYLSVDASFSFQHIKVVADF